MEEMMKRLDALLKEGRTDEALHHALGHLEANIGKLSSHEWAELHAFVGWAYYRQEKFEKARIGFELALHAEDSNERALLGMANIAAHVDQNSFLVSEYMDKLPYTPARDNAWVILARSPKCIESPNTEEQVLDAVERWIRPNPQDPLNVANISHNAARFFLDKPGDEKDKQAHSQIALCLLASALALYGMRDTNLHHRAEANYWSSVAQERLYGPAAAIPFACESLKLWFEQLRLDPNNPHFETSYIKTEEHLLRQLTQAQISLKANPENTYLAKLFNEARKVLRNKTNQEKRDVIAP